MKKICWLLIGWIALSSCGDKTQINLVSGTLHTKCNVVLPNQEIALKAVSGGGVVNPAILGSAISAADGSYNFTYELKEESTGTGEFILTSSQGFTTLVQNVPLNEDVAFDYYEQDTISITINLEGGRVYTAADTLFFGYNGTDKEFSVTSPVNGVLADIQSTLSGEFGRTAPRRIYYGVGKKEFSVAKNQTANETAERNVDLNITPCELIDTARIIIN